jgi:hypothetical protein
MTTTTTRKQGFLEKLNGPWHERALWLYLAIVILHWMEHLVQAAQIWLFGMPRAQALGALGYLFPWLVKSETLHFTYALLMFIGLVLLRPGFRGVAKTWWTASLVIQTWHLFEHSLLQYQAIVGKNFFGSPVPTSIVQHEHRPAVGAARRTPPLLQPGRVHPDGHRDVAPHATEPGGGQPVLLRGLAARHQAAGADSRLIQLVRVIG